MSAIPRFLPFLAAVSLYAPAASAVVLVEYNFSSSSPSVTDPSVDPSDIRATQFQVSTSSGTAFLRHNSGGSNLPENNRPATLEEAIIRGNTYIEFDVTPTTNGVDLATFQFTHSTSRLSSDDVMAGNFESSLAVFASSSGFTIAPSASEALYVSTGTTNAGSNNFGSPVFNLEGYSGLTTSDTITFRVYAYGSGTEFNQVTRIDDVIIDSVPEPASAALLGLAGTSLLLRRRRLA